MSSIADLFFTLRGDDSQLVVDASKAGDAAGTSFGSSFGAKLKQAAGGVIGAGIGLAVGSMVAGIAELDGATRQLQADTGMTAEEAKKAEKALTEMYRNNLQGFAEIGEVMGVVHNDLGLVGKAADETTAKFLRFATATRQDAAEATRSFDDILDAWNLTAEDAGPLMDKLIVSHQQFGGVISESEAALVAMAPAMQAGNMSIDDGIALLNLFNIAGIDAAKAPAALAKAVKLLKPGQDINDLIAQIAAIEDPTERAQLAMEIFGARSGLGMAQAIKPGMTSLADLIASMGDTTGATDTAADAIEGGFGNWFKLTMHNASGALVEFGNQWGGLATVVGTVAATLGPQLTKAIGAGLGGLAGILVPRVTKAVAATGIPAALAGTRVGKMIGTAMGAAIPLALTVGLGVAIGGAIGMALAGPGVDKAKKFMSKEVGEAIANAVTPEDFAHMRKVITDGMDQMPTILGWDIFGGKEALQAQLDAVDAEVARRAQDIGREIPAGLEDVPYEIGLHLQKAADDAGAILQVAGGQWAAKLEDGTTVVAASAEALAEAIPAAVTAAKERAEAEAAKVPKGLADAIIGSKGDFEAIRKSIFDAIVGSVTDAAAIAEAAAILGGGNIREGFKKESTELNVQMLDAVNILTISMSALGPAALRTGEGIPVNLRAGVQTNLQLALDALQELHDKAGSRLDLATFAEQMGFAGIASYIRGLETPDVVTPTTALRNRLLSALEFDATPAGRSIGDTFGDGLTSSLERTWGRMGIPLGKIRGMLGNSLPTEGPLQHPEKGGFTIGEVFMGKGLVAGLLSGMDAFSAALPTLSANGVVPSLSANGATAATGAMATSAGASAMGPAGGITYQYNLSLLGGVPYRFDTRDDFIKALDDLSGFGGDGRLG